MVKQDTKIDILRSRGLRVKRIRVDNDALDGILEDDMYGDSALSGLSSEMEQFATNAPRSAVHSVLYSSTYVPLILSHFEIRDILAHFAIMSKYHHAMFTNGSINGWIHRMLNRDFNHLSMKETSLSKCILKQFPFDEPRNAFRLFECLYDKPETLTTFDDDGSSTAINIETWIRIYLMKAHALKGLIFWLKKLSRLHNINIISVRLRMSKRRGTHTIGKESGHYFMLANVLRSKKA